MPLAGVIGGWYNINDLFVGLWILIYVIWRIMKFKRFVINLDRRPDRLAEFFERYGNVGDVTRFSAVDGNARIKSGNLNFTENAVLKNLSSGRSLGGVFGCWMSHVRLWDELIFSDYDAFVIFEDDAFFVEGFHDKLNFILSKVTLELDIVYFGGRFSPGFIPGDVDNLWFSVGDFFNARKPLGHNDFDRTTHGYVITRAGARKLIDIIYNFGNKKLPAVDDWLNTLREKSLINSVDFFPHTAYSPANYKSDIR
jgi:GR25 family glycosyltransferase involved in LPS biosynthesis